MNRILLNTDQIATGKEKLREIRLNGLHQSFNIYELKHEIVTCYDSSGSFFPNKELDFEAYLDRLENIQNKRRRLWQEPVDAEKIKLDQEFLNGLNEIVKYGRGSKLKMEEAIIIYPEIIHNAARYVTAIPPSTS